MKFNFRKIASALASTAMVSSTIALAAAASFPAPFVNNGAADVAVVYGSNLDLGAVTEITSSLSAALASSASGTPLTGDAYPLFTGSSPIELNSSINSVRSSVTETSLPSALGDSSFSGNVDSDLTFQIHPGSNPRAIFAKQPTTNDDPQLGVLYSSTAANYLYNATVNFGTAVNFTHADTQGEEIELFGRKFTIASATDSDTLVLFQSSSTLYLRVGGNDPNPSETITVESETYTVELIAASDTSATVRVTDSSGNSDQKEINEAASKKINGLEVSVSTADESTATNVIQAEIIAGAQRLTLEDGSEVKIGTDQDPIEGTQVAFEPAGASLSGANLTKLVVQVFAEDGSHDFITPGQALVDPVFGGFRVAFNGLAGDDDRESINIASSGNDKMNVGFTNWQDDSLTNFEWYNNETVGVNAFLGDSEDWKIFTYENALINESAYAMVGNEDEGYIVRLRTLTNSSDSTDYSKDTIVFENVFDTTQTWDAIITAEGTGTVDIGGKTYNLVYWDDRDGDNDEYVRLNYPDSTGNNLVLYPTIETGKGGKFAFYEPVSLNLDNIDGTGSNAAGLMIPDGDGYTTIGLAYHMEAPASMWNVTFGSTTTTINTTAGGSAAGSIGPFTYNVTFAAGAGSNTSVVYIKDVTSGLNYVNPGITLLEEQDESNAYNGVLVEIGGAGTSDNGVGVSDIDFTWNGDDDMTGTGSAYGSSGLQRESDDDLYDMMDLWGTLVTTDQSTSDQYTATISYPNNQVSAEVYFDSISSGETSTLGNVRVMDSEVSSSGSQGKNLLVVGGSCVNTVASTLLGGAGCGSSWTAATGAGSGEWIVQTFANPWSGSKVATLVGGWDQGDTANAATYLTTQSGVTTDAGAKWTGTTSNAATLVASTA